MAGYTDYPFRRLCSRYGAGMVYTELISAEGIVFTSKKTKSLMQIYADEKPAAIQLFGKNPDIIREAVLFTQTLNPLLIDINMGCCAPKVCSSGSGAALLKNPPLAGRIAEAAVKASTVPVTAKIRLGWDQQSRNYDEMIHILHESGIAAITVHGRTRSQFYEGSADWQAIEEIADTSPLPIIGNGDIHSFDDALGRLAATKCAAVMIGRASLGRPWIFSKDFVEPYVAGSIMKEHLNSMIDMYGEYGIILFRKHAVKYIHDVPGAARIRHDLLHTDSLEELFKIIEIAFEGEHVRF